MMNALWTVVAYVLVVLGIAAYVSRRQTWDDYFLNKRRSSLLLLSFSHFSTLVGAGATVAIVAEVYRSGISYGLALPVSFAAGAAILGSVAGRIRERGGAYGASNLAAFFGKRFDKKNEHLVGIVQLFLLITWIGIQAIAMAALLATLTGIGFTAALLLAAGATILYTAVGGLKTDLVTDVIQFWIILAVFCTLAVIGFRSVPSAPTFLGSLPQGHLDPFGFGGVAWFVGAVLLGGFIYLGNTSHWQRILSADSPKTARASFYWQIPLLLLFGLLVLFLGLVASTTVTGASEEQALFALMQQLLPPALMGIGYAAILAVIMSSVDSLIIGGSSIIADRVSGRKNKKTLLARLITAAFGIAGFAVAFAVPDIIALSLLVGYLALLFVPAVFAALYSTSISADASFLSILIPSVVLFAIFGSVGANSFLITTPLSVLIVLFYDKGRRLVQGRRQGDAATTASGSEDGEKGM